MTTDMEEEARTIVLVNRTDEVIGSASLLDRVELSPNSSKQIIHRTASLFVFTKDDTTGHVSDYMNRHRVLLTSLPRLQYEDGETHSLSNVSNSGADGICFLY